MKYAPESIIAMMLTVGLVVFLIALTVKSLFGNIPIGDEKVKLLESIITSMIAIVGVYVGSKLKQ